MSQGEQSHPEGISGTERQGAREGPFRIFIHNDDVTPMDFVVHLLVSVFLLPVINAEQVMLAAHLNGRAYVQTLQADEAQRRIGRACFAARLRRFPLQFSLEAE